MLKQLQHTNITQLLDVAHRGEAIFLAFEFLEENLFHRLRLGPLALETSKVCLSWLFFTLYVLAQSFSASTRPTEPVFATLRVVAACRATFNSC